jgi:hypothetical protein
MNPDPLSPSSSSAPQAPPATASRWRSAAADIRAGARAAAPPLGRAAGRLGDWLARIGWGKFFLLSILLLVGGAMLSSLLSAGWRRDAVEPAVRSRSCAGG